MHGYRERESVKMTMPSNTQRSNLALLETHNEAARV
jgi:hypothetical protein